MTILVYGAGAVGSFFGGLLARAGEAVHFVARGPQLEALRTAGLTIDSRLLGRIVVSPLPVSSSAAEAGSVDLVLVCVKTQQLPGIFGDLASVIGDRTAIVPLQNGVEADEQLSARFPKAHVLPAVVYVGATVNEPGIVEHVAAGTIGLGAARERDQLVLAAVRDVLARSGQPVHISNDIQRERWHKLMWNAAFNSVSAVTGRVPAALVDDAATRELVVTMMREVLEVGRAHGVDLRAEDIDKHLAWTETASGVRTSTMVDRERGREMEIDGLVGVIVRKGLAAGVPTPSTRVVYTLLKAIDGERQRRRGKEEINGACGHRPATLR